MNQMMATEAENKRAEGEAGTETPDSEETLPIENHETQENEPTPDGSSDQPPSASQPTAATIEEHIEAVADPQAQASPDATVTSKPSKEEKNKANSREANQGTIGTILFMFICKIQNRSRCKSRYHTQIAFPNSSSLRVVPVQ